jgi:alkylation response protein AidB-like acyl-CoA dehydrogenase
MDFTLATQYRELRAQLRELLTGPAIRKALRDASSERPDDPDPRSAYRLLGQRGWLAPDWPAEYGGAGLGSAAANIVTEELAAHGIPDSAYVNSVRNAGQCLLAYGSPELRDRLLPPMARGDTLTAVLYTEHGSGSDLASLATTAEPDGSGGWRLHGVKAYSVKTAACDNAIVAARTSRSAQQVLGITLFVMSLRGPGVSLRALPGANHEPFYEVAFDGAAAGAGDVLGSVDNGWLVIVEGLAAERVGMDYSARVRAHLNWLSRRARQRGSSGLTACLEERLRRLATDAEAGRLLAWSMAHRLEHGDLDPVEAAMSKWLNSELMRDVWQTGQLLARPTDLLTPDSATLLEDSTARLLDLEAPGLSLSAGTSEMMLQVVANELGLGDSDAL